MFINEITKIKSEVQKRLEIFFAEKIKQAKRIDPIIEKTAGYLADQTLNGGKRIRAALVVQGFLASSNKFNPAIYDIGASMELIHSYLLIHDDIIDQDDLRRGKPSMHCRFANILSGKIPKNRRDHFGASLAILAGDIASVWAYEIFSRSAFPDKNKLRALGEMNQMIFKCGSGEILDVALEYKIHPKEKDVFDVQFYKTASYTIEGPLAIGALLGGARTNTIQTFRDFARPLGLAFQIQDDIFGLFSNEKEIGKPVGSDLRQGKRALLILHALERADKHRREIIAQSLGNKNISKKDIDRMREIVRETNALARSQALVEKFSNQAKKILQLSSLPAQTKSFLFDLIEHLSKRSN